jgi:micrococcal nuclease
MTVARVGALALCLCVVTGSVAQNHPQREPRFQARVVEVVDGDTVHLLPLGARDTIKARLNGIDAPEICQPFGPQSRDALTQKIHQKVVIVESPRLDDYGRSLAVLYLNNDNINAWLVNEGYAWSYGRKGSRGPYASEESQAKSGKRGLFADSKATRPRDFRRKNKGCP